MVTYGSGEIISKLKQAEGSFLHAADADARPITLPSIINYFKWLLSRPVMN